MQPDASIQSDLEVLVAKVQQEQARLAPLLPDIDPSDLNSILVAIFRPWGMGRRFFIRRLSSGANVF
jgi:hypothetical protein